MQMETPFASGPQDAGQGQAGNPPSGQKFSPPPQPEINVRTMASDNRSVEIGEPTPIPEAVLPPEAEKEAVFRPETQPGAQITEEEPPKKRKALMWVILGVVVVGVGAAGYFVYPLLFAPAPAPAEIPEPSPTAIVTVLPHQSFFVISPASKADLVLANLLPSTITSALQTLAANKLSTGSIQETAILDDQNSQIQFSSYVSAFLSGISGDQIASWFEDDFTAFLYYDDKGAWPGFAARMRNGVNLDTVKINMSSIEQSELSRFYLVTPRTFGGFKDGQLNGAAARYAVGSEPGAAFNYGFFGSYFLVSTSYDGVKTAAALLGI